MTTYFNFQPQTTAPFQFQPTLDGNPYQAEVIWNVYGQGWYLSINSLSGPNIVTKKLIGSTDIIGAVLTTTAGSPLATLSSGAGLRAGWAVNSVNVPVGTTIAILAGTTVRLSQPATISGVDSTATFSFDVNLVWGYFSTSTLVFREAAQQFEVNP